MTIQEPSVREMAGVFGDANSVDRRWVELKEHSSMIQIEVHGQYTYLTVSEARKLARQLNRLARRVEIRQEAGV